MRQSLSAEWLKLRHSRIGLVLIILPVISLVIGCANFYFNQGALQNGWYSLWSQVSLFYGEFFLPILIAICCAYVCRLEHNNRNWNMILCSPIPVRSLFLAKLVVVGTLILMIQVLFMVMYWLAGNVFSLSGPFPMESIGWSFRGWFASLAIIALQLGLSIRITSFGAPIGISLCAVFIGLGMYIAKAGLLFPFSLLTIGMHVLNQESLSMGQNMLFWIMGTVYIVMFSSLSIRRLKNKDIVSS